MKILQIQRNISDNDGGSRLHVTDGTEIEMGSLNEQTANQL